MAARSGFGLMTLLAAPAVVLAGLPTLGLVPLWFPASFYFFR